MKPPYQITSKIVNLIAEISLLLGKTEGLNTSIPQPQLRRRNRIKTIQATLAIEGNSLDLEQVTALFDNKHVLGSKKEILEVKNAISLYQKLHSFNPNQVNDLLQAHAVLMQGLTSDGDERPGKFRTRAVGLLKAGKVSHLAPPAKQVPKLMSDLFEFLKKEKETSYLIRSCIFHYELEFIHPFFDGNGRMGRFWQHLILTKNHFIFEFLPFESLIKESQTPYYQALEESDKKGDSTPFIEFSLETIRDALKLILSEIKPLPEPT